MEFIIDVEVYDMNITMDRGKVVELYCCEVLICGAIMSIQTDFHNLKMYIVISKANAKIKYQEV